MIACLGSSSNVVVVVGGVESIKVIFWMTPGQVVLFRLGAFTEHLIFSATFRMTS